MARSTAVGPSRPSTTSTTAEASSTASRACSCTLRMSVRSGDSSLRAGETGSKPPVSTPERSRCSQVKSP